MSELRCAVKLLDGPEGGNVILGHKGEPPDRIVVFRTQLLANNVLVCCPDDGKYPCLPGDAVYRKVSRSDIFDRPDWTPHPNIMPGCAYEFVGAPESQVVAT